MLLKSQGMLTPDERISTIQFKGIAARAGYIVTVNNDVWTLTKL